MATLKKSAKNYSSYPFYLQWMFLIAAMIGLYTYVITGLNEWVNIDIYQVEKTPADKVCSIVLTVGPISLLLFLLVWKAKKSKTAPKILIRESKSQRKVKNQEIQSENAAN